MGLKRIVLIILSVVLIGTVGIIFMVKSWNEFGSDPNKKEIENQSFKNIEVSANNAAVEIIPTTNTTTTVEYSGKNRKNTKYILNADVKGETLSIELKEKRRWFINFDFTVSKIILTVKVPEKQYNLIQVTSENGKIKMDNMQSNTISFETDNGAIELNNVEAKVANVKTDNGRIVLNDVNGEISGTTDNGRITFVSNNLERPIELTTDNGRIEIKTEQDPKNATFDVKTDNGRIDIFGKANEHTVFGNGENKIKLRSDNGRITVSK